jgi:4-hydroxybenzoate polyprenyltransferase
MRIEQWVKCILVLSPLVFAHEFSNLEAWKNSVVGMFLFCLMASSVYMLNDLFDVWDDRRNQEIKKKEIDLLQIVQFLFSSY